MHGWLSLTSVDATAKSCSSEDRMMVSFLIRGVMGVV